MVYLDNAATSFPKPAGVVEAVRDFMLYAGANPGRSGHRLALAAGRTVDKARRSLAQLLQVEDEADLFFGLNCTDMLNTAIQGIVEPGWEVATTIWEHNSVLRPLNELQSRGLITLRTAATIEKAMTKQTKLVVPPTSPAPSNPSSPSPPFARCGGRCCWWTQPRRPACCPCIRSCGASTWWPCQGIRASWAPWAPARSMPARV